MFRKLKKDNKGNEFYIFPGGEDIFKREVYNDGRMSLIVTHPDGYNEHLSRRVGKIWETTVSWNIASMASKYAKERHLSCCRNLKVYAFPACCEETVKNSDKYPLKQTSGY